MPPSKLAHVVFQTNRMKEMRDWYCSVLGGHVIYENPHLSFVTYDDEHHRVAFLDFGPLAPRDTETELHVKATEPPGLHHVALSVLLRQPRPHDLDVLPGPGRQSGRASDRQFRDRRRRAGMDALAGVRSEPDRCRVRPRRAREAVQRRRTSRAARPAGLSRRPARAAQRSTPSGRSSPCRRRSSRCGSRTWDRPGDRNGCGRACRPCRWPRSPRGSCRD